MGIEDVFVAKRLIATLYELLNIFKKIRHTGIKFEIREIS